MLFTYIKMEDLKKLLIVGTITLSYFLGLNSGAKIPHIEMVKTAVNMANPNNGIITREYRLDSKRIKLNFSLDDYAKDVDTYKQKFSDSCLRGKNYSNLTNKSLDTLNKWITDGYTERDSVIRRVFQFVNENMTYQFDHDVPYVKPLNPNNHFEFPKTPLQSLVDQFPDNSGVKKCRGDCEDFSLLAAYLLNSAGIKAGIAEYHGQKEGHAVVGIEIQSYEYHHILFSENMRGFEHIIKQCRENKIIEGFRQLHTIATYKTGPSEIKDTHHWLLYEPQRPEYDNKYLESDLILARLIDTKNEKVIDKPESEQLQ